MDDQKYNASIEVEGKTVDDAIDKGLKKINLTKEDVEIKVLDEGASGLFGLMGTKPARVKITPKKPGAGRVSAEVENLLKYETEKLLKLMGFQNIGINVIKKSEMDDDITINISSDSDQDISLLIGRNGKTIAALELLLQTIINHRLMDEKKIANQDKVRINVDVNRYYERKAESAMSEVSRTMSIVKKTGKPQKLEPMPSKIRRYIHNKLKDNPDVVTVSEGDGAERRIIIKPKR